MVRVMKGDFSRIRFNPAKHYAAVLEQQGRVALDADANEQCAIDAHLRETETTDVVGRFGAPVHDAGFQIAVQNKGIVIGPGRYYVDGLLCENPAAASYEAQPLLLNAVKSTALIQDLTAAGAAATIRVFLQAWQRLVTALDDPCLREPALGQADTTARLQTVYRVVATLVEPRKVPPIGPAGPPPATAQPARGEAAALAAIPTDGAGSIAAPDPVSSLTPCCQAMYAAAPAAHTGSLAAQTSGGTDTCGCQPIPAAGYRGLENQLYRVEIHHGGTEATATFKWSRENGSVVVAIHSINGADVTVSSLGPDANLGFQVGQWVEISDDTSIFGEQPNQPGRLYQIKNIVPASLTITMTTSVVPVDPKLNARLRRWDQTGTVATANGIPLSKSLIDLENGIQVEFGAGQYVSGDYWTIPARTATGQIEWPPCGSSAQASQPPYFVAPYYTQIRTAPLACIHYTPPTAAAPESFTVDDCRLLFYPLTELTPPARPSALHVTKINWVNDDVMTLDRLVKNGLAVTFDQAPDGPVTPANFVVTIETPVVFGNQLGRADNPPATPLAASQPAPAAGAVLGDAAIIEIFTSTVPRGLFILDSTIGRDAQAKTLTWTLPFGGTSSALQNEEVLWIDALLLSAIREGWPSRVRIKLLGNVMFAGTGTSRVFLDGVAFGQPALRGDGKTPRIDLQLPSGNDQKAGDFESWFYLYPTLQVASAQVTYTSLVVRQTGGIVSVTACTPAATPLPTAQLATITLNYPALVATPINLSLQGPSGIVTAPSSVTIAAGASSIPVTLSLIGVPAAGVTASFTLIASITNAIGVPASAQSQPFTITAAPPLTN
jgi:hypothetical protein